MPVDVKKSLIEGPNGEIILEVVEDVTDIVETNKEIREKYNGWHPKKHRKMLLSVPPRLYYFWAQKLGEECWFDKDFIRSFLKQHPEYATCDRRGI